MQKLFLATAEATVKEMEADGMLLEAKTLRELSKAEVLKPARPGGVLANVFQ